MRHHNKSYDYENNKKQAKTKNSAENCEKCRSHLNHKLFSENFISDPLNLFSKPMGAINIWIMWYEFKSNQ